MLAFGTAFFYFLEGWRAATPSTVFLDYVGSIPFSCALNGILDPTPNIRMHTLIHQQKRETWYNRRLQATSTPLDPFTTGLKSTW